MAERDHDEEYEDDDFDDEEDDFDDEEDDFDDEDDDFDDEDDDFDDEEYEDAKEEDQASQTSEEAEPWDLLSQALGSLDGLESDEDLALDVTERGQDGGAEQERFSKVPLDQAANLIAVRQLAAGVKDGSVSIEVFRSRLKLMVRSLEEGLKIVRSDTVQEHIEALPEEQKAFFVLTGRLVEALVAGGHQMLRYPETRNLQDVDQGLATIEQAFVELDEMQSRAIDMGREMVLREEAMNDPRQRS
jgi:hypothetical protein